MKNIKFLLGLLTIVVIMASCATTQGLADDEYTDNQRTQQIGNRLYVQDPFYGTVVLERDPYTGRYYDVTYGSRYGYGAGGYYGYPNRGYRTYRGGSYGRGSTVQQGPSRQQVQQKKGEARRKILGN